MRELIEGTAIKPANLWTRIKAQCLNANPYIREDAETKQTVIRCPHCGQEALAGYYRMLDAEPAAVEWSAPIRKCLRCGHLFAFVT